MNGTPGERLIHEENEAMLLDWRLPRSAVNEVEFHQR